MLVLSQRLSAELLTLGLLWLSFPAQAAAAEDSFKAGFARADISPTETVLLSGYAVRNGLGEKADAPIYVRAMAFQHGNGPIHLLVGVESIGFPAVLSEAVFNDLPAELRTDRARFVMTSTHSHTAPHVAGYLSNLFLNPPSAEELAATGRYTDLLRRKAIDAATAAAADLRPARLQVGEGKVGFAKNRRGKRTGVFTGLGEAPAGPVDHSVPVLKITEPDSDQLRGVVMNYACHCTTFGPQHTQVNGDWAGYAMANLEAAHPECVAICTIGCGADANPMRGGDDEMGLSKMQGKMLSDEVAAVMAGEVRSITEAPTARYATVALPSQLPTEEALKEQLRNANNNIRAHAEHMLGLLQRNGELPATYPMPIQVWRFGDQFTMVFLGGEVVVDYSLRLKQELGAPAPVQRGDVKEVSPPLPKAPGPVWISAYSNDVFGYVASERVRNEGGYEFDSSMIYYLQPGPWQSGTEELIIKELHELIRSAAK